MVIKFPRFVFPASVVGTAIGLVALIKDRSRGVKYASEERFSGKTAVITGANSGIGKATALELAKKGGRIILACRNLKAAYAVKEEIIEQTYNRNIEVRHLDLSSLKSINDFVQDISANEKRIDVLVNNAGVMTSGSKRQLTSDGFEMNLGVNYLGAFLLTNLLLPKLLSSKPSRIVNVVSVSMNKAEIRFEDLNSAKDYDPYQAYGQSKLALMSFTDQMSKLYKEAGVTTYAVYPGVAPTNLARDLSKSRLSSAIVGTPMSVFMRNAEDAAQTVVYCCVEPGIEEKSGLCIKDMEVMKWETKLSDTDSLRLWRISEKWTRFDTSPESLISESKQMKEIVI